MRRGHVVVDRAGAQEPPRVAQSPILKAGQCPKCLKIIGRGLRGHAMGCGVVAVAAEPPATPAAPHVPTDVLLAPKPLIGPQPGAPKYPAPIVQSPQLPRLLHGEPIPGERKVTKGRRRVELSKDRAQAEAVARLRAMHGLG